MVHKTKNWFDDLKGDYIKHFQSLNKDQVVMKTGFLWWRRKITADEMIRELELGTEFARDFISKQYTQILES